jgi:hypothetical protein
MQRRSRPWRFQQSRPYALRWVLLIGGGALAAAVCDDKGSEPVRALGTVADAAGGQATEAPADPLYLEMAESLAAGRKAFRSDTFGSERTGRASSSAAR